MKTLNFAIFQIAGMSEEHFSPKIMVGKPYAENNAAFTLEELNEVGIQSVSELIEYIKMKQPYLEEEIGPYGMENICYQNVYLMINDYLIGLDVYGKLEIQ